MIKNTTDKNTSGLFKPTKKQIMCLLENMGHGKTKHWIDMILDDYKDSRKRGSRILVLTIDYKTAEEFKERLLSKADKRDINISVMIFHGKTHKLLDDNTSIFEEFNSLYMCERDKGKYVTGCSDCPLYPDDEKWNCPYQKQYQMIKDYDVVISTHSSNFLGLKTKKTDKWRKIIIDEALDSVLYKTYTMSEQEWLDFGISWDTFPRPIKKTCSRHCSMFDICKSRRPDMICGQKSKNFGQSEIITMKVVNKTEPEDDEQYFIHKILERPDIDIIGSWDFYNDCKCARVTIFDYLAVLNTDKLYFSSATVTRDMIEKWFFKNYEDWEIIYEENRPDYKNELIFDHSKYGGIESSEDQVINGTLKDFKKNNGIPEDEIGLVILPLRVKKEYRVMIESWGYKVDHYPCVGVDKYKNCSFVILTSPNRYNLTIQYHLSEIFNNQMVVDMIDSHALQAIGRIRIGNQSWLSAIKKVYALFNFDHQMFVNRHSFKEKKTKKWIENKLSTGSLSGNKLYELVKKEKNQDIEKNKAEFFKLVKQYKSSCHH
ncbi:hypothetical protein [Candidatus Lokiarchaeum ossiferum]|uniref:hypothetical protein n=1 Tax=Candidatus Lokiarchaeum ossiferum TaxID=2951803 RepID=UPI00352DB4A6